MTILSLVTPPVGPVVEIFSLTAQLRVTDDAERALIEEYERAAVAYLDGWGGVLGRAIKAQTWRQEFDSWGTLRLAMPDVTAITVTAEDDAGETVTPTLAELRKDAAGFYVLTDGPSAARIFVEFTCGLPAHRLPVARQIVRHMVAHWFAHRETVAEGSLSEIPLTASELIGTLRAGRF